MHTLALPLIRLFEQLFPVAPKAEEDWRHAEARR